MTTAPRMARGTRTRGKLVAATERVFSTSGYHDASILKITEEAGVGLGTLYLYFAGKKEIFDDLVHDLNHRVRQAMSEASGAATSRLAAERAGFRAFFRFTAEHPALYRIIRQAEFVSPEAMRMHYSSIVEGYIAVLRTAQAWGEVRPVDPTVASWALMGAGELIGMWWVLWEQDGAVQREGGVPEHVFEVLMDFIQGGLGPGGLGPAPGDGRHDDQEDNR